MGLFSFKSKKEETSNSANKQIISLFNHADNSDDIFKAYIPNFLYKPPYGMPRNVNTLQLKALSKNPFVFSVIKTLCDEATSVAWELKVKEEFSEQGKDYTEDIKKITKFFKNPNGNEESFEHLMRQLVTDIIEVDSGVLVKVFNRAGELKQLFSRDGATFLINPDIYGYIGNKDDFVAPLPDGFTGIALDLNKPLMPETQELVKNYDAVYRTRAAYFQYGWTAGSMPVPFGKREIVYMRQNPRSDSVYGRSPIEVLQEVIYMLIYGVDSNLDFYTNNGMPEGVIELLGAEADQIKQFRENFQNKFKFKDAFGNIRKRFFSYPVTNTQVNWKPIQLSPKDMEIVTQQQWFTKILWMTLGVNADEMGYCYSDDTRVLTDNGLKFYNEIGEEDKIATVNELTHNIEYIKPDGIHTFDVEERNFHHYKNKNVDVLVSADHRMLFRTNKKDFQISPSEDISADRIYFLQGGLGWVGEPRESFSIPQIAYENNKDRGRAQIEKLNINDFCEFMGYYLSEGSILNNQEDKKVYTIKISQTKESGIKLMSPLLNRLGFRREKTNWALNDKSLATYLSQFGDCTKKFIPEEIKQLPKEQLQLFFDALVSGDGCRSEDSFIRYSTTSKRLAEDVAEVMFKLGYSVKMREDEKNNPNWSTEYIVYCNDHNLEPYVRISEHRIEGNYTGVMWCPSVKNRPFITERNGRFGIHYNTETSNRAVGEQQASIFKRKAIKPILNVIQYHINTQIIPEFFRNGKEIPDSGDVPVEFCFDSFDVDEETKKHNLFEQQIRMGIKTPDMVAAEMGIDLDELKKSQEDHMAREVDKAGKLSDVTNRFGDSQSNFNSKPEPKKEYKEEKKSNSLITEAPKDPTKEIEDYIDSVGESLISAISRIRE